MSFLDLGIGAALAAGVIVGMRRGLLRLAALILSLAVGWGLGLLLQERLARLLPGDPGGWRSPAAFLLILTSTMLGLGLAGRIASRGLAAVGLGWLDRGAGAAAGLVLAVTLTAVLLRACLVLLPGARPALLDGSRLGPRLLTLGQVLHPVLRPASSAPARTGGGRAG